MEKDNKTKKRSREEDANLKTNAAPVKNEKVAEQPKIDAAGGSSVPLPNSQESAKAQKANKPLLPPWFVIDR